MKTLPKVLAFTIIALASPHIAMTQHQLCTDCLAICTNRNNTCQQGSCWVVGGSVGLTGVCTGGNATEYAKRLQVCALNLQACNIKCVAPLCTIPTNPTG